LALDDAMNARSVVLLHGCAGVGKTATAAGFARYYSRGPALFTSFAAKRTLPQILDECIGPLFGSTPIQRVDWAAMSNAERCNITLKLMAEDPVFWVWDNVEPIDGFPPGRVSEWSETERTSLTEFLRAAAQTKAKFLLTSRCEVSGWPGVAVERVHISPMPMQERLQLLSAVAEKEANVLVKTGAWTALAHFSAGNPLASIVLVRQALRAGLKTAEAIDDFVASLRSGNLSIDDDTRKGREGSLGVSLGYGFDDNFSGTESQRLAFVTVFQDAVNVEALCSMGDPASDSCVSELRGLSRTEGITMLNHAADIGLLDELADGVFRIHPGLPWFFRHTVMREYPDILLPELRPNPSVGNDSIARAFVQGMSAVAESYRKQYVEGRRDVIVSLNADEGNLMRSLRLAQAHGWWRDVTRAMQAFNVLYHHTGRTADWRSLVETIVPDFVEPATDGARPGREAKWSLVTSYRVNLAIAARHWEEAERLQGLRTRWDQQRAAGALALDSNEWNESQREDVTALLASLTTRGNMKRERGSPDCIEEYEEALALAVRLDDRRAQASCAFALGHAYIGVNPRDLKKAEFWYRRSLDMHEDGNQHERAQCLAQLGQVQFYNFIEAAQSGQPPETFARYLQDAFKHSSEALALLPADTPDNRASILNLMGCIFGVAGQVDQALQYWREAIRGFELAGNTLSAASIQINAAATLLQAGKVDIARELAGAAVHHYEAYGDRATSEIEQARALLARIEQDTHSPESDSASGI
jgi:tetratricopeptide (TPR) repeat protein